MRHATVSLLLLVSGCTTVEGTGRSQFNVYAPSEEVALGEAAYTQELKGAKVLPATDPRTQRVRAIGKRIEMAARQRTPRMASQMEWDWTVVDDPETVNAWMVPGGKACVYTGMLDFARSDDELAVVMGHEASHAIARHGTERMSESHLLGAGVTAAELATGSRAAGQGASTAAQLLVTLPHSRKQESEADELGLLIAAQAGYDPRSAIDLWQRMQSRGSGGLDFLSTHPSESTRIERLQALMPRAMEIWQRARTAAPSPGATSGAPHSPPR